MSRPVKVRLGEEVVDGIELNFESINESWNEYACEDGSTVRVKIVVAKITHVVGRFSPTGEPLFIVSANNVVTVSPPPGTIPPRPGA